MSVWKRPGQVVGAQGRVVTVVALGCAVTLLGVAFPAIRSLLLQSHQVPGFVLVPLTVLVLVGAALVWILLMRASHLKVEASTDHELDVLNSRECRRRLEEAIVEADRHSRPFTVGLVDVDGLKAINDTHGYRAGDLLLKGFVDFTRRQLRATDRLFRYRQGDEFLILYKDTEPHAARAPSERLRCGVGDGHFQGRDSSVMTVSIGLAGYQPESDFSRGAGRRRDPTPAVDELLRRAEVALAKAKRSKNTTWLEMTSRPAD